jgi:ribonucleoside-diphosphate reductase beta chain
MLDSICSPAKRNEILYQWKTDERLLARNEFIGNLYNDFLQHRDAKQLVRTLMANYILEGIYFYSGFMFFYNLGRMGKMPGSAQEIRYINRDENTHLWLFRNMILELKKEEPELFTPEDMEEYRQMLKHGVEEEIRWAEYCLGDTIEGLTFSSIKDYIEYLGNLRAAQLGFAPLFERNQEVPQSMEWVNTYSNANMIKTDFFEAKSTAYAKAGAIVDDL